MRRLVIIGAGAAGTMLANKLWHRLSHEGWLFGRTDWQVTIVDRDDVHLYQGGLLFLPFGMYRPSDVIKTRHQFIPPGVDLVFGEVDRVLVDENEVVLDDGRRLPYDYVVIASGASTRPDRTPGLLGPLWRSKVFDFYTYDGALALAVAMRDFTGGRLVVHTVDMPIKSPLAPVEFAFLADAYLRATGRRERTELVFATPLPGPFTKPIASARLAAMMAERGIAVEPDFFVEYVDDERKTLVSYDDREIPFDLLVTVPVNMGADYVARSGLGNDLNYVPVDRQTMLSRSYDTVFAIGDATDIPSAKAGAAAYYWVETFVDNFCQRADGLPMTGTYDGHVSCFVESGDGKGLLVDFNYDTEPLPGNYPIPGIGPFRLLAETRLNHSGKLAFRWLYWNVLLPGHFLPLPTHMSMAGKHHPP
jgi:sulfide:quinone oxidoreductase